MAKVKAVESTAEFLTLIEKSGLLSASQLEQVRGWCAATEDPKQIARQAIKEGVLSNWQATQLLGGFTSFTIGDYQLVDQIGKGDLSRIYRARKVSTGDEVALKMLASKNAADPQAVERFLAEGQAAAALKHPHVLQVLEVGADQERPYLVTEFVAGGDLQQHIDKRGALPATEAAELIAQAAEGMAYVHSQNILHRDLKPANLLLDATGNLRILDAGVSHVRLAERSGSESTGELLLSALGFQSPEQIRAKDPDARSDVYSLGGTLYFLLTGRVPFTATNNEERDVIRKTKRPVPISQLKPDVPVDLATLCDQMMALKATDRPESMTAVATKLRAYLQAATGVAAIDVADPLAADLNPLEQLDSLDLTPIEESAPTFAADPLAADPLASAPQTAAPQTAAPQAAPAASAPAQAAAAKGAGAPAAGTPAAKSATAAAATTETSGAGSASPAAKEVKIVIGGPAAGGPVVSGGLKIQRKKKADIETALATAAPEAADPAMIAVAKKAKKQRLILISVAVVSLVVIVGSVAVLMMGSKEEPVATKGAGTAAAPGAPAGAAADKGAPGAAAAPAAPAANDPENLPDPEVAAAPAEPAAAPPATTPAAAPSGINPAAPAAAAPAAPAVPAAAPTTPAAPPATTPANPMPPATPPPAATPAPTPTTPAPTTPAPAAPTAPAEPSPAAPPETPPAAPAKPATPPAAPPKKAGPTFEIAKAVNLPALATAENPQGAEPPAKVLGKVNIDPKDTCFISLFGGDKATRTKVVFAIRNAQGGTAPRDWELTQKESGAEEVVVATLSLPTNELKFEWTEAGQKSLVATHLRNCALKITAGQEEPRVVALRTVLVAPPLVFATIEKPAQARFNLDAIPDGSALKIELNIPNQKIMAETPPDITKNDMVAYFGESKEQAPLAVQFDTNITSKGIQVEGECFLVLPGDKPQKLTPALKKKREYSATELKKASAAAGAQLDAFKKMKQEEQAKLQNEINLGNLARQNLDKRIAALEKFEQITQQFGAGAKVHMRIYYETGDTQIDLVKTDDNAPAPAGK